MLLAIFFWVTLIFLFQKLYKLAIVSAAIFFLLGTLAMGRLLSNRCVRFDRDYFNPASLFENEYSLLP
jgi:hypothetical protein